MSPLYRQNPNDATSGSTLPITQDGVGFFSHATCPAGSTATKRPTYVVINQTGSYKFSYENTPSTYITGSVKKDDNSIKLDISPTAWEEATGVAKGVEGDVTFVYVRVR